MLQDIRRQGLGKSGLKFRHGGGGNLKWPKKFRRLLWTAPYHLQVIDEKFSTNLQIIEAGITKDKKNQEHCMNIIMNTKKNPILFLTFHPSQKLKFQSLHGFCTKANRAFGGLIVRFNSEHLVLIVISQRLLFLIKTKKIHLLSFFSYKKN